MSWRQDLADQYSDICDVHMMQIPSDIQIDRRPVTWWRQEFAADNAGPHLDIPAGWSDWYAHGHELH